MATEKLFTLTTSMAQQREETIKKEKGKLLHFIKSKVNNLEDAEDILQEVLLQFVDAYGAIDSIEKATSWLFRVANNKIVDLYRWRNVRSNHYSIRESDEEEAPVMLKDILPDFGNNPDEVYFRDLIWDEVTEALDELPEEQRRIFVLHEFEGVSFKEMSELMKTPVNTLISRKRYAVLTLRKRLEDIYKEIGS